MGRGFRWHKQDDRYALPFESREAIEVENAEDENLRLAVLDSLRARVAEVAGDDLKAGELDAADDFALRALQLLFEQEGLELAAYIGPQRPGLA